MKTLLKTALIAVMMMVTLPSTAHSQLEWVTWDEHIFQTSAGELIVSVDMSKETVRTYHKEGTEYTNIEQISYVNMFLGGKKIWHKRIFGTSNHVIDNIPFFVEEDDRYIYVLHKELLSFGHTDDIAIYKISKTSKSVVEKVLVIDDLMTHIKGTETYHKVYGDFYKPKGKERKYIGQSGGTKYYQWVDHYGKDSVLVNFVDGKFHIDAYYHDCVHEKDWVHGDNTGFFVPHTISFIVDPRNFTVEKAVLKMVDRGKDIDKQELRVINLMNTN